MVQREEHKYSTAPGRYLWKDELRTLADPGNLSLSGSPEQSLVWQGIFSIRECLWKMENAVSATTHLTQTGQASGTWTSEKKENWRMGLDIIAITDHMGLESGELPRCHTLWLSNLQV